MFRLHLLLCLADAEIRTGDGDSRLSSFQLRLLSSNGNYES
jgi:hypothetical protein